jgi:hypothetical protein
VRSSTSSSERQPPAGGSWTVTWLVAILAASLTLTLLELHLRERHRPAVVNDTVAWVEARRAADDDPRVVAFVGGSRMALAVSLSTLEELAPGRRGVQLAITGTPSLGIFEDLAADESFRGIVIVDAVPWELSDPLAFTHATSWVERDKPLWRMPGAIANRALATPIQERFTTLALGGRQILTAAVDRHSLPDPRWTIPTRRREVLADYSLASPKSLDARHKGKALSLAHRLPGMWIQHLARIERAVHAIRARGGDVVFFHLPNSGMLRARENELYPRDLAWDAFAAATSAKTIHFADVPAMSALECPDGDHLDGTSQNTLTRALVAELRARGVL